MAEFERGREGTARGGGALEASQVGRGAVRSGGGRRRLPPQNEDNKRRISELRDPEGKGRKEKEGREGEGPKGSK